MNISKSKNLTVEANPDISVKYSKSKRYRERNVETVLTKPISSKSIKLLDIQSEHNENDDIKSSELKLPTLELYDSPSKLSNIDQVIPIKSNILPTLELDDVSDSINDFIIDNIDQTVNFKSKTSDNILKGLSSENDMLNLMMTFESVERV